MNKVLKVKLEFLKLALDLITAGVIYISLDTEFYAD